MSKFFRSAMVCAPSVLFIIALVQFLTGFLPALMALQRVGHDLYGSPQDLQTAALVEMTLRGMESAALPLFGAAILWRVDRYWACPTKEALV